MIERTERGLLREAMGYYVQADTILACGDNKAQAAAYAGAARYILHDLMGGATTEDREGDTEWRRINELLQVVLVKLGL